MPIPQTTLMFYQTENKLIRDLVLVNKNHFLIIVQLKTFHQK